MVKIVKFRVFLNTVYVSFCHIAVALISHAALQRFYASLRTNADLMLKSRAPVCDCTLLGRQAGRPVVHRTDV